MKKILLLIAISVFAYSCNQRIELDEGQWGTFADITTAGVVLFQWKLDNVTLAEGNVQGAKSESITLSVTVDATTLTATTKVKTGVDLTKAACYIYHNGKKVEPLNGAPVPGVVSDYSAKQFMYRIFSADGVYKDWKLVITQ
jgi:hypothetical protein